MWGKHNEIRALIKKTEAAFSAGNWSGLAGGLASLSGAVKKLIFLEEKILFPTAARKLNTSDWARIKKGEPEIGYAWIKPSNLWDAQLAEAMAVSSPDAAGPTTRPITGPVDNAPSESGAAIDLSRGSLTAEQIDLMLKALPFRHHLRRRERPGPLLLGYGGTHLSPQPRDYRSGRPELPSAEKRPRR